jgi:hypothetical protein
MPPQQQQQGPCLLVFGIILAALGFVFDVWFLIGVGVFLFIIGICVISQEANKAKTQTAPEPVAQPAVQPAAQPAPQPRLDQKFCPHCGAKTTGEICSSCGSKID